MKYDVTLRLEIRSDFGSERVEKQIRALFEWGTVKESFADGLRLRESPELLGVDIASRHPKAH